MNPGYSVIECKSDEFLYIFFKSRLGRAGGVAIMTGTSISYNLDWATFVDSRGRRWDVPRDNIGAIITKKEKRSVPKGIWEPATND